MSTLTAPLMKESISPVVPENIDFQPVYRYNLGVFKKITIDSVTHLFRANSNFLLEISFYEDDEFDITFTNIETQKTTFVDDSLNYIEALTWLKEVMPSYGF